MKLKALILAVLLLCFCVRAEEQSVLQPVSNPVTETATVKDGYALLNSLLTLFENLPVTNGIGEVETRLSQLSKDTRNAHDANVIDNIFSNRYRRLLMIFKLIVTPVSKNEMLEPIFVKAFTDFVWDVTYERWVWGDKDSLHLIAAAMEEEFVQLQFYLDSRQARGEFKKKIGKLLPPPPPSTKKKPEVK
jgi:hypothetical protein